MIFLKGPAPTLGESLSLSVGSLKRTASSPLKIGRLPQKETSSSKFSGAMLNFGEGTHFFVFFDPTMQIYGNLEELSLAACTASPIMVDLAGLFGLVSYNDPCQF